MLELNCKELFESLSAIEMPENPILQLSSSLIIGGKVWAVAEGKEHVLFEEDFKAFMFFAVELAKIGVTIKPKNTLSYADDYGDDFVRDKTHAELIVSGFVNKDYKPGANDIKMFESPLLAQGYTWKEAFAVANGKFIGLSTNHVDCVGIDDIPENYEPLIEGDVHCNETILFGRSDVLRELGL